MKILKLIAEIAAVLIALCMALAEAEALESRTFGKIGYMLGFLGVGVPLYWLAFEFVLRVWRILVNAAKRQPVKPAVLKT